MILTKKQAEGLLITIDRYNTGKKYTVISGYAGSGKSTLVRFIIEALDVDEDDVCYCAFTGKASEVLHKKGNKNTCTLHKLLYESIPKPTGGFFRKPKSHIPFKIIVLLFLSNSKNKQNSFLPFMMLPLYSLIFPP